LNEWDQRPEVRKQGPWASRRRMANCKPRWREENQRLFDDRPGSEQPISGVGWETVRVARNEEVPCSQEKGRTPSVPQPVDAVR
jgi:hypothetical protein